ncbi:MAG: zinc ribbon domain-containing protein [Planctomycetota bacterium]|nr:MAG: zinc ribbon domain-containing protein [Planctomycetota bacterium]
MLIACGSCHRQYDVTGIEPGQKIRCHCGAVSEVRQPTAHDAETLHCAACGGDVRTDQTSCEYCDAPLSLAERGIGDACPRCFARLVKDAAFCSACGVRIEPQIVSRIPSGCTCPRCEAPLARVEAGAATFTECTGCGGIWLEEEVFHALTRARAEAGDRELESFSRYFGKSVSSAGVERPSRRHEQNVRYLACPVCGEMMNRKNFARCSGVVIDWCKGHGYWFDTNELEEIFRFIQGGGLEKSRNLRDPILRKAATGSLPDAAEPVRQVPRPRGDLRPIARSGATGPSRGLLAEILTEFLRCIV